MDFRILGPLEVRTDDAEVALGGGKPRAVLAVLLLHANEVVSTDRLIAALWGERPPETAVKALQVNVSQLRKALALHGRDDLVRTRAPGYVLVLDADELDLHRFRRLHAEARDVLTTNPGRAAERLREALALWRGSALADFTYASFAQAEIASVEESRLVALEDRIQADLALGRHAAVTGELEALVREHPLRERLRVHLMLARYRAGRQADALAAYQGARRALTDELGIEPGRELRELQQAILAQDPRLDLPPEREASLAAPARPAFVGRERELAALTGALADAVAGHGRVALVAGEPGIGKSRLAEELVAHARARGADVIVGRCWEAGGAPAYWPWVQSLRAYVADSSPDVVRELAGSGAGELTQLLPELPDLVGEVAAPLAPDSEGARFRLFESVVAFLRRATRAQPLVLVLDDLHAADEPSLLLLRFVAREIAGCPLLVLAAYRDIDPALQPQLVAALAELVREPHTVQVSLGGLARDDVCRYIELSTGVEPADGLVATIHAGTEGNPLFVTEVSRLLDAEGRISAPDADLSIPPGVRAVIGRRVARLSEPCRHVLSAASVLGREFGLDALVRLCDQPADRLLDVLDQALAERIVADVPDTPGRLRFGHALIRETLYDDLTVVRRMQLHRDAGAALEAVYAADLDAHLAELAHHAATAVPAVPADRAVDLARRAGDRAAALLAYEEAVRLYRLALGLVEGAEARCELLLALGDAQARAGDTPGSKASFLTAADVARSRGLPGHLARAALGYGGRMLWDVFRDDDRLGPLLEQALAALGEDDSALRVRLLARLAAGPLRNARQPPGRRRVLSAEALELARRLGDPATLCHGLQGYIVAHHSPAHTHRQLELTQEFLAAARRAGDKERIVEAHEAGIESFVELADLPAAHREFAAMAEVAHELRQPSQEWLVRVMGSLLALLEGRFTDAEGLIAEAIKIGEHAQSWSTAVSSRLQLYMLRREQGRTAEVEDLVRRTLTEYPGYPICRCVLAQVAADLGDLEEARRTLDTLAARDFRDLPFDEEWLVSVGLLAETARALDAADHAGTLYALLEPYADRVAISYPEISTGSVSRSLGILAATRGDRDAAERHFAAAIETNDRIGARPWAAHACLDRAQMLLSLGDAGAARGPLREAIARYRDLGMDAHAERAAALGGA